MPAAARPARSLRPRALLAVALAAAGAAALARPAGAEAPPRLAGNVLSVDAEAREITLLDAGKRHVVRYGDATLVKAGAAEKAVGDLRRGDRVVVTFGEGDPEVARLIAIAGAPSVNTGLLGAKHGHGGSPGVHSFAPPLVQSTPR